MENKYCLLHNVGQKKYNNPAINANYNTREQISSFNGILTFDGIYRNVFENEDLLENRKSIFFIMGDYIGKDNRFDVGMPYEKYCSWEELNYLKNKHDIEFGWHTWSHGDLTKMSREDIIKECTAPFKTDLFAYPYGKFNQQVIDILKELGYKKAFSVIEGDNTDYQILRPYIGR